MEFLFDILLLAMLGYSTWLNIVFYRDFLQTKASISELHENLFKYLTEETDQSIKTSDKIDAFANGLDRSLSSLRELLENTKPIKPNNWDSVKEAFKGPTRIEINERT